MPVTGGDLKIVLKMSEGVNFAVAEVMREVAIKGNGCSRRKREASVGSEFKKRGEVMEEVRVWEDREK